MSKFTAKNAVVWVWSEFFPPGTCDETPSKLQEYFDNGYVIAGDYICEEMTELNYLQNRQRNIFLRLQVPVVFSK